MKIALINDTHFGARNDNPNYANYFYKFWDDLFFPYIEQHNIKQIIHLGDVLDRRKFVNFKTLSDFNNKFVERVKDIDIDIIIGNHDTYYKNTNEVNSLAELVGNKYSNIKFYEENCTVNFGNVPIFFCPWINSENYGSTMKGIQSTNADICMGHLEINGFEMHKGHYSEAGYPKEMFKKFDTVFSGHFHKKSDDGHIYYLGTQYEITWSDYRCPKGFHILDTETRELTRVPNPMRIHKKLIYNDKENDYVNMDLSSFKDTFVKVFVTNKTNEEMFNNLIDRLHNTVDTHEVNIIEDLNTDITASVKEDILEQGEDTLTFLGNYVEQIDSDLDKHKLKNVIKDLYTEASER